MPRRVQDIVPNKHRSIRDIPVERPSIPTPIQSSSPKKKTARTLSLRKPEIEQYVEREEEREVPIQAPITPPRVAGRIAKRSGAKKLIFIFMGVVVVVAAAGYIASVYFSYASFTIVPKVIPFTVNSTYVSQSATGTGILTYELVALKGDASATVVATDGPKISSVAKGRVTLYNNYSTQTQRLIAGTRLADDTGRIYRLSSSVVIPGYTSANSKITPGSIVTSISADQPGQSYNITKSDPVSDFNIVAYKGGPRYDTIFARIASDISGGFVGVKKTISPTALASTTLELQGKIIANLATQLKKTVPVGYIMYPRAYVPVFSEPVIGGVDPKSATVTIRGTVYGILFKHKELVARVAGEQAVAAFDDFAYETPGLESLDFSIVNAKDFSPEKKNTLIIRLKGNAQMVGSIPVDDLKKKLAGLSLAETSAVLRLFKPVIEIEKSSGSITPPWSKVPNDIDRIEIEVSPVIVRTEE